MVPFVVQQLQRRRARAARHRQVASVPAGLALRAPRLRRQGDGRPHVRQHGQRPARPGRQYDVVCFDEVSGVSFDQKDGVNIMKGYMESGEFSRGKESHPRRRRHRDGRQLRRRRRHQQRVGHLLSPLPPEMRNDTAFMDRIHAYLPGWDVPKLDPSLLHRPFRARQRLPHRGAGAGCAGPRESTCSTGALSGAPS